MTWRTVNQFNSGDLQSKEYWIPVFGIGLIILAFYTVFRYFMNAPIITLNKRIIKFGESETYDLKDCVLKH
jgi:hypothetical protein